MLDLVAMSADDSALAEDLQVEEVLQFSVYFENENVCAVCKQVIQSLEASWKPYDCDHIICIACFSQYAHETEATGMPSCVSQYIAAKVEENVLSIGCPDPGCKNGVLHPEACRDMIPLQLYQRWGAALCDSSLGELKFYCPFKECSALLVDDPGDGEEVITNVECPHCCRMFCAQCKVPWHDGVTCTEFQRLGKDERGREDLLLRKVAQKSKWQRCPKCKVYVERVEGCVGTASATFVHPQCRGITIIARPASEPGECPAAKPYSQRPPLVVHSLQLREQHIYNHSTMLDLIYKFACDLVLAEDRQAEEVLSRLSTHPERFCAVCKLVIPSLEASWKPDNCDHVICIACLWQYAQTPTGLPLCAVASCESLKLETHQGIDAVHRISTPMEDMYSGKGEEPLDAIVQEVGQCSRGANTTSSSEFYCTICMDTVHSREIFLVPGCKHLFCISCLSQYIIAKVELFQRWVAALCDLALGAFKFYCPFEDCSALLVDHGPHKAARKAECPHCSRMFCVQCKVAWHYNATCEDFQRFRNDEQRLDDMLLRKTMDESMAQHDHVGSCESLHNSELPQGINVGHTTLISIKDMDHPKGKKPFDTIIQEGQSSGGANLMVNSEFYCTICMETMHVRELFPVSGCTHLFCVSCMIQYITGKVEDNVLSIGCPEPGCKDGALDLEACRDVIPLQLFERWGTVLCDSVLGAAKLYCPFNDCSALLVHELGHGEAAITQAECPHCSRMFCVQCKVAWHNGATCEDFQKLENNQ
nr:unnamed protein product [Digitaria exilis]